MLYFEQEKLVELLSHFNRLTGIKVSIFDDEGRELSGTPDHLCAFCEYVRSSEAGRAACLRSDTDAFAACRKSGKPHKYRCHMGLTECVAPIVQGSRVIGFIMMGQTTTEQAIDEQTLRRIADTYALDGDTALALYRNIDFSSEETVKAAVSVLDAVAGYLYLHKLVREGENTASKLENYVRTHIDGDLSVRTLCRIGKLSRVDLYDCFRHAFDCTPAEFVRRTRLNYACELLATPLSVTQIAQKCGIGDYNYFSKMFHARYGMSPSNYRRHL